MHNKLLPYILALIIGVKVLNAADLPSLDFTTVQNAVSAAAEGATIDLPAGAGTWTATQHLTITKNITLVGKSRLNNWDQTIINGGGKNIVTWHTTADHHTATLKGITFLSNQIATSYGLIIDGLARFNGTDGGFRVTECKFGLSNPSIDSSDCQIRVGDWITGVFDHCFFDVPYDAVGNGWLEMDTPGQPGFVGATAPVASASPVSVTFTTSSPTVHWNAHGKKVGQGVMFSALTFPSGISADTVYYITNVSANAFDLTAAPLGATTVSVGSTGTNVNAIPTDNLPQAGFYSYSTPWNWGNDFEGVYVEDCVLQRKGFLIKQADGPSAIQGGGSRIVVRHSSLWGAFSGHGFSESGSNGGTTINESYNNIYVMDRAGDQTTLHNLRSGAAIYANDRMVGWSNNGTKMWQPNFYRSTPQKVQLTGYGDGTCFFDQNARGGDYSYTGTTLDPVVTSYTPHETTITSGSNGQSLPQATINVASTSGFTLDAGHHIFVNTKEAGTQDVTCTGTFGGNQFTGCGGSGTGTMATGNPVVGPLVVAFPSSLSPGGIFGPVTTQQNGHPGVPNDDRIGAVYAKGNASSNPSRFVFVLTGLDGGGTVNKWAGFTLRNATASQDESFGAQVPQTNVGDNAAIITDSSTGANCTVTVSGGNEPDKGDYLRLANGENWEIRFLVNGVGFAGGTVTPFWNGKKQMNATTSIATQVQFYTLNAKGQSQYFANQRKDGVWWWGSWFCPSVANLLSGSPTLQAPTFNTNVHGRFTQGGTHAKLRSIANGADADYPTQTNDAAHKRIGADWDSGTFGGKRIDGTSVAMLPTKIEYNDTTWPANWRATVAYGSTYPHPLVIPAALSAPTMAATGSASIASGALGSTPPISANGNPAPTFSVPTPGTNGVPSWLTINSISGVMSGTPPNTIGSPFTFTVTATNSSGSVGQTFTLTVTSPNSLPSVQLATNGSIFTAPAFIILTASPTDSDGTISKVDFYQGGTNLIGTVSAAPWVLNWTNVVAGDYSLTAKATDNGNGLSPASNSISVSVTNPVGGPSPPARITVKP